MAKKILILLTVALISGACQDFFLEEVEYNQEDYEKQLVVNALFRQDQSLLRVVLNESSSIGVDLSEELKEGKMKVYLNDQLILEDSVRPIQTDPFSNSIHYLMESKITGLQAGDEIKLQVFHPDYLMTESKVIALDSINLDNYYFAQYVKTSTQLGDLDSLFFTLALNDENTAALNVRGVYSDFSLVDFYSKNRYETKFFGGNQPIMIDGLFNYLNPFVLDVKEFQNGALNLPFYAGNLFGEDRDSVKFIIRAYDNNFYNYNIQVEQQKDDIESVFTSPKAVHGNWSNSFGFFGVVNQTVF